MHKFEKAGLGTPPFRCVGMWTMPSQSMLTMNPTAYNMAMANRPNELSVGSCAYCGTGLVYNYIVKNAEGRRFVVGCECVNKTGDEGLIKEVKRVRVEIKQAERMAKREAGAAERRAAYEAERMRRAADFESANADLIETARSLGLLEQRGEFIFDVLGSIISTACSGRFGL
jgi:hypothetical protein